MNLDGKVILITGGTGSFGNKFTETIIKKYKPAKLIIYSRDELKQFEMSQIFPITKYPFMRYFLGDVRDKNRLLRAFEEVDVVVHAAAIKQVPAAEYNPFECIKTNVLGAQNIIEAALDTRVEKVIALSTDKAAGPINLYGATKLCSDKLFTAANIYAGTHRNIKFSVVRYGNVMGSRGSVIPFFKKMKPSGILPITDERMTRFNITLEDGVNFTLDNLGRMHGGEIFIPRIPSYKILDVAKAIAPECKLEFVGIRPGEKIHEEMITEADAVNTLEFKNYFVILPSSPTRELQKFIEENENARCAYGFKYNSGTNTEWLNVEELKDLIEKKCK